MNSGSENNKLLWILLITVVIIGASVGFFTKALEDGVGKAAILFGVVLVVIYFFIWRKQRKL